MAQMIHVTEIDISQAMHGNARFCPIGIALHRQGFFEPHVGRRSVTLGDGRHFPLPDVACARIKVWDGDSQHPPVRIAPFSFEL